ncbi:MAG: hypothetical protein FWE09_00125 [Treponema sp.]|nr:hypothetical protein [Treponema sp.]
MTRCEKCGAEVRYIPCAPAVSPDGIATTDAALTEVITARGRAVAGYRRHECPERPAREAENAGVE